jgi:hypothetical protein
LTAFGQRSVSGVCSRTNRTRVLTHKSSLIGDSFLMCLHILSGPTKCESTKSLIFRTAPKFCESINQRIASRFGRIPKNRESVRESRWMLNVEPDGPTRYRCPQRRPQTRGLHQSDRFERPDCRFESRRIIHNWAAVPGRSGPAPSSLLLSGPIKSESLRDRPPIPPTRPVVKASRATF